MHHLNLLCSEGEWWVEVFAAAVPYTLPRKLKLVRRGVRGGGGMADSWLWISHGVWEIFDLDFCHTASGAYSRHGRPRCCQGWSSWNTFSFKKFNCKVYQSFSTSHSIMKALEPEYMSKRKKKQLNLQGQIHLRSTGVVSRGSTYPATHHSDNSTSIYACRE